MFPRTPSPKTRNPISIHIGALSCLILVGACTSDEDKVPRDRPAPGAASGNGAMPGNPSPAAGGATGAATGGTSVTDQDEKPPPTENVTPANPGTLDIPPGAVVYYVDALGGDDSADGRSPPAAWKTLDKVSSADVGAGEFVLFKRGQTFEGGVRPKNSGSAGKPITFASYDNGPRPVLTSKFALYSGFELGSRHDIVVRNVDITQYDGPGIHVDDTDGIDVFDVVITETGRNNSMSAIHGNGARRLTIDRVTLKDVTGDAVGIWGGDQIKVLRSMISGVSGGTADAAHIAFASNVEVRNNWMDLTGTNSGKGLMCICVDDGGTVADNVLIGGNYGIGIGSTNFTVENNWIENSNGASWSYGIGWGGDDTSYARDNMTIRNNVVLNNVNGIASFYNSGYAIKNNLQIYGNTLIGVGTGFASWGADFTNSAYHDNTVHGGPVGGGPGLNEYNNVVAASPPNVTRPPMTGRGAF